MMDMNQLFESARQIAMPDDMRRRILAGCQSRNRQNFRFSRRIIAAAALIAVFCLTAAIASGGGFFRDVKNLTGAVVGTEYLRATEEIRAEAVLSQAYICVSAEFLKPDSFPFRVIDALCISDYSLLNAAGKVVSSGATTSPQAVSEGRVEIPFPLDDASDPPHTLVIRSFTAFSKADQPVEIHGEWTCPVTAG